MGNIKKITQTVNHIAAETSEMSKKILGKAFPIKSLTIFSHSEPEYNDLCQILAQLGKPYNYNNGPRVELHESIKAGDNLITHLRIRKPDPERPQIGCNDFETDYENFKNEYLVKYPQYLTLIKRQEYEMIELHYKDFNVLAYVVSD